MRQEVAAAGPQQVHFLADVILQLVKAGFGGTHLSLNLSIRKDGDVARFMSSDLLWHKHATVDPFNNQRETWNAARWWFSGQRRCHRSNLAELFHLFVSVWIEFLRHVLHPEQRSSVFRPGLLHLVDGQPGV